MASCVRIIAQHLNVNRAFCEDHAELRGESFTRDDPRMEAVAQNIALFPHTVETQESGDREKACRC